MLEFKTYTDLTLHTDMYMGKGHYNLYCIFNISTTKIPVLVEE